MANFDRYSNLFFRDAGGVYHPAQLDTIVSTAKRCLDALFVREALFDSPQVVRDYLVMKLARLEHEVFGILYLDAQHRLLEYQEMFRGSVSQTSVYPREVVREALRLNAVAAIAVHNHPSSGLPEPSRADEALTSTLKTALALVDVRLLDHIVVGGGSTVSFAERGLL